LQNTITMKKIIYTPKIIISIILSIVFMVTGIFLGFQNKAIVQTVEAVGQQYDLLDYYLPNSDYVIHMNNGEKFHTFAGVINSRSGFTTLKSAEGKWYEEYTYDNDKIYLNRDTTWATGFNQNVKCTNPNTQNDAAFVWLLGHYEKDEARSLVGSDKEGGVWIDRRLSVGDTTDRGQITVTGFDKTTCQPCDTQYVGKTGGTVKLVEVFSTWKGGADGKEFNDVAHIWVTGGTGSGEHFYLAKGIGRVGWKNDNSFSYGKVVENGKINKVELCSNGNPGNPGQPTPTPTPKPLPEICKSPNVFGINTAIHNEEQLRLARDAGATITRLPIAFNSMPERGVYDWDGMDSDIKFAQTNGMEVLGLIVGTPWWAGAQWGYEHRYLPHKEFEADYRAFLREALRRYPEINKFVYWNEPNGCGSSRDLPYIPDPENQAPGPTAIPFPGCGYSDASAEEYAYWLGVTYNEIKTTKPSAVVSMAGLEGIPTDYVRLVKTKPGGNSYDVISLQPYNWTGKIDFEAVSRFRNDVQAGDIWITEYGWDINNVSEADQARYLRETFDDLMTGRYDYVKLMTYHTIADPGDTLRLGLVAGSNLPYTNRPAYDVFQEYRNKCDIEDPIDSELPPVTEGWLHPGIDIEPVRTDAYSNNIFSTHAGFVTYAGPAPASVAEKGWLVQIEADLNRDNVPDVITRYTHLMPGSTILVNDVRYKRRAFTPECFMDLQSCFSEIGISSGPLEKLPYGYGPYVSRNQLIGMLGDSGSPGRKHIQYEIITNRYTNLYGSNLNTYDCRDNPYLDVCITDYARPGFFFSINRNKPDEVRGPVYTNPGFVTPPPIPPVTPTPTPGPEQISCLNETTGYLNNSNFRPEHNAIMNNWLSLYGPSTEISGIIHYRDPFTFGQPLERIANVCQPGWEVSYRGIPSNMPVYHQDFYLRMTVPTGGTPDTVYHEYEIDFTNDPYENVYLKDVNYKFTVPANAQYELIAGRGQSHIPSMGNRNTSTDTCMEGYVWGNARNEPTGPGNYCGVTVSCDLDRPNTNNTWCCDRSNGNDCDGSDCGGPYGWGNSGKYWAEELGSPTKDLINWRNCQP